MFSFVCRRSSLVRGVRYKVLRVMFEVALIVVALCHICTSAHLETTDKVY